MKFDNETELKYKNVEQALKDINVSVPHGVKLMANIVKITEMIGRRENPSTIVGCSKNSLSIVFKKTTGVSVLDVPKITRADLNRERLSNSGFNAEQIENILETIV